jgi:hypothetical protein
MFEIGHRVTHDRRGKFAGLSWHSGGSTGAIGAGAICGMAGRGSPAAVSHPAGLRRGYHARWALGRTKYRMGGQTQEASGGLSMAPEPYLDLALGARIGEEKVSDRGD